MITHKCPCGQEASISKKDNEELLLRGKVLVCAFCQEKTFPKSELGYYTLVNKNNGSEITVFGHPNEFCFQERSPSPRMFNWDFWKFKEVSE